jgi:hypothetical protein
MTHLLSEIQGGDLSVGPMRKAANGVPISPILFKNQRGVEIQIPDCSCLFPPSGFDQSSSRLSVVFKVDAQTADEICRVEAAVAASADLKSLHSAVRRKEGFDPTFKCKVDPTRVQYVDSKGQETPMLEWQGLRLRLIVSPRSLYHQPLTAGVIWDLVALQILDPMPIKKAVFR